MTVPRATRVRAHVADTRQHTVDEPWVRLPDAAAVLVHVLLDERGQRPVATIREVLHTGRGLLTIDERVYTDPANFGRLTLAVEGMSPDVRPGLALHPLEAGVDVALGRLLCRRSYRMLWPMLAWDVGGTFGSLADHAGPAQGGFDGFSIGLPGTGLRTDGAWVGSWHYPTLILNPRSGGQPGVFASWVPPKSWKAQRHKHGRPGFVDLQVLASALAGGDFDAPAQACAWFEVAWPDIPGLDPLARVRAEAAALSHLYIELVLALERVAEGLAPHHVWSFGSIAEHALAQAGVLPPLGKATGC